MGLYCCEGFSPVAASRGYSLVVVLPIAVTYLVAEHGPWSVGFSSCSSWALRHRLHSCGTQAQLLRGIWDLPGSGIEPTSPALAGGFLTTKPPRKLFYPFLNRTVPRTAVSLVISLPGNIRGGQRNGSFVWQLAPLAVNILKVWTWGLWIDGVEQIKVIFNQACLGFTGNTAL